MKMTETEISKGPEGQKLAHERGAGSPCLKCGPACTGLDLHFWRKKCKVCFCKYEDHDVQSEEEIHHKILRDMFHKQRGLNEGFHQLPDIKNELKLNDDVSSNFIQVPKVSSSRAMSKFLDTRDKKDEENENNRMKKIAEQLPVHDFDDTYCDNLTEGEKEKMQNFNNKRAEEAAGQGEIVENLDKNAPHWVCEHCKKSLHGGDIAIFADRMGRDKCWHPDCFVCASCKEVLVDLLYFYKDDNIYCGRHYGELTCVRCAACDELIFSKEYTQAEDKSWHLKHFCCQKCDTQLGGQRYVARDGKPYCMKCYDTEFAKVCQTCNIKIAADAKRISFKETHWHATEDCFHCRECNKSLLGNQFIFKDFKTFCTPECARKGGK